MSLPRVIFLLLFLSGFILAKGQFSGSGTSSDPYSGGTLTGNQTWLLSSSPIYVSGDLTIGNTSNAGHLTIEAGVTVRFCSTGADMIITGLGQLTADGTSSNKIIFTADTDKDGNYGESGETWGHISFQSVTSSNNSIIDNCIIEFGYKYTGVFEINSAGGAIYTDFSNLTISNSIIRNNFSGFGGGIYIREASPALNNLIISNNTAAVTGGGCSFYRNCIINVTNCIFEKNTCNGGGGGGGVFMGDYPGNLTFYNCVFASNVGANGANIRFFEETTTRPKFYNTIIWGSNNSIAYYNYTPDPSDFNYCAIQGYSSGYTNCINLNSSNTAADGPNFTDPGNLDYSIALLSPCRDAGTSSGAPSTDFFGNSRVLNYDIGIHEVQYSRWKTTATGTDWNSVSNWDGGIPNSSRHVIIPTGATNYPTGSATQDFTIGTGQQMIVEAGARVTLDDLVNNGKLLLNHAQNNSDFSSLILNTYTRGAGGSEEIQLYLSGGGSELLEDYKWHYISSPVTSLSTDTFTGVTLNLAQFVESRPSTSLLDGWVAYDGYVYSTGITNGPVFNSLTAGKGYNYWDNTNNTFTFGGLLNTSDAVMSLSYTAPVPALRGYNLLGNPFSSGLDWDLIANSPGYPANTSKGVYFTRNNQQCTYIGGVGTPGDVTGIIPPMQGFFTKTYSASNSITLAASARTNSGIHARYKSGTIIPLIRIELRRDELTADETVVRFDENAKTDMDLDFDALKMFISSSKTQIYTESAGAKFAINGQPFPSADLEIPLTLNITKDTLHKINTTQLQGLDNYKIYLKDITTGYMANLKTTPVVSFSAAPGTISGRFSLLISSSLTGTEVPSGSGNPLSVYPAKGMINIIAGNSMWDSRSGSVRVTDLTGKRVAETTNAWFSANSLLQVKAPAAKGIYIVELRSGALKHTARIIIR